MPCLNTATGNSWTQMDRPSCRCPDLANTQDNQGLVQDPRSEKNHRTVDGMALSSDAPEIRRPWGKSPQKSSNHSTTPRIPGRFQGNHVLWTVTKPKSVPMPVVLPETKPPWTDSDGVRATAVRPTCIAARFAGRRTRGVPSPSEQVRPVCVTVWGGALER